MKLRIGFAVLLAVGVLSACGDDDAAGPGDAPTSSTAAVTTTQASTTTTTVAPELPDGCESVPYTVDVRVEGDGELVTFEVVDAIAARIAEGRAYTVYLADFPIDREDTAYSFVTDPPAGGTVVQTGLTVFNAPDAGAVPVLEGGEIGEVQWQAGELAAFLNITADDAASSSTNMTGTGELLYVDEQTVCIAADITSERGFALIGVYAAEITADF